MHPLNHSNFGSTGMVVTFWDGSAICTGYITKQLSQHRFTVSNGTTTRTGIYLAPTTDIATDIGSNHDHFTIPVYPHGNGSGEGFSPVFLPSTVKPWLGNEFVGRGYIVGDVLSIILGTARVTVTSVNTHGALITAAVTLPGSGSGTITPTPTTFISGGTAFQASISGNILTIGSMTSGTVMISQLMHGAGVSAGTVISAQLSGTTGGVGTYRMNHTFGTISSEAMTSNGQAAFLDVAYVLDHVDIDGTGTDYAEDDVLVFKGMRGDLFATARISSVLDGGVPDSIAITNGRNIRFGYDTIYTSGPVEYVKSINGNRLVTTEGNAYYWTLGSSRDQSALIQS